MLEVVVIMEDTAKAAAKAAKTAARRARKAAARSVAPSTQTDGDPVETPPGEQATAVSEIADTVATLLRDRGRREAMEYAMRAIEPLLENPDDDLRRRLRKHVFNRFVGFRATYQVNDFESVDYEMYELSKALVLLRGPLVPAEALERGDYFCVMGAAQTFGRLAARPWATLLSEAIGLPVLNLSRGGGGPDFFLEPPLLPLIRKARFVVLQVVSGRSVGCEDFPGGRRIQGASEDEGKNRREVLERLWNADRNVALDYVRRWNSNYLGIYRDLRTRIGAPTMLLWLSGRRPADWSPEMLLEKLTWGDFPQLVGADLFADIAALFEDHIEYVTEKSSTFPVSRITGKPCPYFTTGKDLHYEMHYYPSAEHHADLARTLEPWARRALSKA